MAKVRVTQTWLEVATQDGGGELNVSQALLEVLGRYDDELRVSQALLEVLGQRTEVLRVSQALLEVVGFIEGPLIPTVTVSNVGQTTADLAGSAYDAGTAGGLHYRSRWIVRNANDGSVVYDSGVTAVDLTSHSVPSGGLPSYTDLVASAMYENTQSEWSYYPGQPSDVFQTLSEPAEAAIALRFYDASMTLLSVYVSPGTTDSAYDGFTLAEEIPIPASTRFVVPCSYKIGSTLTNTHTMDVQVDIGKLSSAYAPTSFKPEIHNETDIPPALTDEGQVTADFVIDWSEGNVATVELAGNVTMSWSNLRAGGRYYLIVEQDTTGTRLLTWPAGVAKFAAGSPPTLSTASGSKDVFCIIAESASVAHVETVSLDSK